MIYALSVGRLTRKPADNKIFSTTIREINKVLDNNPPTNEELIKKHVPAEYHEFAKLFSELQAQKLPQHRRYNHKIRLKDKFTSPFGPLYSLLRNELEELQKWLKEILSKGFIRASSSPATESILFVKKKHGSLSL